MGFLFPNKRERLKINIRKGKAGESAGTFSDAAFGGWESKRTGRGHDYKQTRFDILSGKKETRFVEYKTGNSKLSRLQKQTKRKLGRRYVVRRVNPDFY